MKHNLLVIVIALFCLLCPAWAGAAAGSVVPLGCTFTGTVNNQATTWEVVFPGFVQYGGTIGSPMYGVNSTTNTGLTGSAYYSALYQYYYMRWTEGPAPGFPFVRNAYMTLGSNLQGTGAVMDFAQNGTFTATITITGSNCIGL